ncbi:hypothetical protein MUP77_06385, partial [Candidatus Bathyarchaeota archaeon]|nr:hypothetical protein [Candidatus Bathyarchaeota archaeon]
MGETDSEDENEKLRRRIDRIRDICFSKDLEIPAMFARLGETEAEKLRLVRLALMEKERWDWSSVSELEDPLEFTCSECGRKIVR